MQGIYSYISETNRAYSLDGCYVVTTCVCYLLHGAESLLRRFAASQEIPPFHGARRFITALTSVPHLSLSWASPFQPIYPHPTSWRSILISTHLRLGLPNGLFPSDFSSKTLYTPLSSLIRATCPVHLILLDFITRTILGEEYKSFSSSLCNLLHSPVTSSLLGPNILHNTMFSNTLSFLSSRKVNDEVSRPYKTTGKIECVLHIKLFPKTNFLYFHMSTFRSTCIVPSVAAFCGGSSSCFPVTLLGYFLYDFDMVPVAPAITVISICFSVLLPYHISNRLILKGKHGILQIHFSCEKCRPLHHAQWSVSPVLYITHCQSVGQSDVMAAFHWLRSSLIAYGVLVVVWKCGNQSDYKAGGKPRRK